LEPREIDKIQNLVNDQKFRKQVLSLNAEEQIFQNLQSEVASQIVVSLNRDKKIINGSNKDQIWSDVVKAMNEFDKGNANSNGQPKLTVIKDSFKWKSYMKYAAIFIGLAMAFS
jgi:transmembrane sensor